MTHELPASVSLSGGIGRVDTANANLRWNVLGTLAIIIRRQLDGAHEGRRIILTHEALACCHHLLAHGPRRVHMIVWHSPKFRDPFPNVNPRGIVGTLGSQLPSHIVTGHLHKLFDCGSILQIESAVFVHLRDSYPVSVIHRAIVIEKEFFEDKSTNAPVH